MTTSSLAATIHARANRSAAIARRDMPAWLVDAVTSFLFATSIAVLCITLIDDCRHAFIVPVLICGGLVGVDAVAWLRGRRDLLDPAGLVGVAGWHLFFAAPLLHVGIDYWIVYVEQPGDWRDWLEPMAWLNVAGLLIYFVVRAWTGRAIVSPSTAAAPQLVRVMDDQRFRRVWPAAMAVAAVLQAVVYIRFGGLSGYIVAFSEGAEQFAGYGAIFAVSETFPILFVIAAAYYAGRRSQLASWWYVAAVLVGFVVLKFAFGGMRGSRGHFIYGLFWTLAILHLTVRPLSRRVLIVVGAALVGFMYLYGFYKDYGSGALEALTDTRARIGMVDGSSRTVETLLLGDLGRADVQAYLLYRLSPECVAAHYEPCGGQTYLGTLALFVPHSLWPDRPPTKIKAGTDAMFGPHVFEREMSSTYSYGLAGEAMLNFGPAAVPLSFVVLALAVTWLERTRRALHPTDVRRFLWPFAVSVGLMLLVWDSDVLLFYTLKEALLPAALLWYASRPVTTFCGVTEWLPEGAR